MCHVTQRGLSQVLGLGTLHSSQLFCPLHSLQLPHGGDGVVRLMGWMWEVTDRSRKDGVVSSFGVSRPCPGLVLTSLTSLVKDDGMFSVRGCWEQGGVRYGGGEDGQQVWRRHPSPVSITEL